MSELHAPVTPVQEEGFNRAETNNGVVVGFTVGTVLFLVISIMFLQYYYDRNYEQQVYVKVLEPVAPELLDLRARENEQLGSYKYINREQGTVNLPIRRAMELLTAEYESGNLPYPAAPYPVRSEEETAADAAPATQ